jgi:hypothetical protein
VEEEKMAVVVIDRNPASSIYCYNAVTGADEVNGTLHHLVRELGMNANIWVVSGTHGRKDGTVTDKDHAPDFRKEDLDAANKTSKQIKVWDYHLLAPNRWAELRRKPAGTNVIVLAFCYSQQWFNNPGPGGNDGKL